MRHYRPLLIENLGLTIPGVEVIRLRLNEHLPQSRATPHAHDFGQLLVYLRGRGAQTVAGVRYSARMGSVVYVPPGEPHQFERELKRRPLCLVLDLKVSEGLLPGRFWLLPASGLAVVRRRVSELLSMRGRGGADRALASGAAILDILAAIVSGAGQSTARTNRRGVAWRAEQALRKGFAEGEGLGEIAARLGYQRDHLNRILRQECGLTLGQLRAQVRIEASQRLLERGVPVGEVGSRIGYDDPSYFARWFKAQTGVSPSRWVSGEA